MALWVLSGRRDRERMKHRVITSSLALTLALTYPGVVHRGAAALALPNPSSRTPSVADTTPPTFPTTPASITVRARAGSSWTAVTYPTPVAVDDIGVPDVVCAPHSGSLFPIGTTSVICMATNDAHLTAATLFSVWVIPSDDFVSLTPSRLADTRPNHFTPDDFANGNGPVPAGATYELLTAGRGGVALDALAAALTVTVTEPTEDGYLTVFACGQSRPTSSNLNFAAGSTVSNLVIAQIGVRGSVCFFVSKTVQLVVDVNGAFLSRTTYVPTAPARLMDSRSGQPTADGLQSGDGRRSPSSITEIQVAGRAGVPLDAAAVVLNLTVEAPSADGYATVYPCGAHAPNASNLNYVRGATIANLAIAKLGPEGTVCVFTQSETSLIVDMEGYLPDDTTYIAVNPSRVLDTRAGATTVDGTSAGGGPLPLGATTVLRVATRGKLPDGVASAALNVTVTDAKAAGFVTIYPCDAQQPLASSVNFERDMVVATAVITDVAPDGTICIFNSQSTNVIVDVQGFYPPTVTP